MEYQDSSRIVRLEIKTHDSLYHLYCEELDNSYVCRCILPIIVGEEVDVALLAACLVERNYPSLDDLRQFAYGLFSSKPYMIRRGNKEVTVFHHASRLAN